MVRPVQLARGAVETTSIAFGCAGLYREPDARARRRLLDLAYDVGIRHFDVAPMYGLGLAEAELAPFIRNHRDQLVLATKFGIDVTPVGRLLGRHQGPVRRLLASASKLQEGARAAAPDPSAPAGRLLYRQSGYSAANARRSLQRSLRRLEVDCVDILLLHDPPSETTDVPELEACVADLTSSGLVRSWGVAGDDQSVLSLIERWPAASPVVQVTHSLLRPAPEALVTAQGGCIVFGCIGTVLSAANKMFARRPERRAIWARRLGHSTERLPGLLLGEALQHNTTGTVIVSSTRQAHIEEMAECGSTQSDPAVMVSLAQLVAEDLLPSGSSPT